MRRTGKKRGMKVERRIVRGTRVEKKKGRTVERKKKGMRVEKRGTRVEKKGARAARGRRIERRKEKKRGTRVEKRGTTAEETARTGRTAEKKGTNSRDRDTPYESCLRGEEESNSSSDRSTRR